MNNGPRGYEKKKSIMHLNSFWLVGYMEKHLHSSNSELFINNLAGQSPFTFSIRVYMYMSCLNILLYTSNFVFHGINKITCFERHEGE